MQNVYGLGEQFIQSGNPNGDWTASGRRQRTPGDNFGNQMIGFGGGADGNAQIPVMYEVSANLIAPHLDIPGVPAKIPALLVYLIEEQGIIGVIGAQRC
jgi:hypothetical protein